MRVKVLSLKSIQLINVWCTRIVKRIEKRATISYRRQLSARLKSRNSTYIAISILIIHLSDELHIEPIRIINSRKWKVIF